MNSSTRAPVRNRPAHSVFFPAAALYAAIILPLSLQALTSGSPGLPALATGLGHAHEMLFGFALAVVAGYLLGSPPAPRLWLLCGLWALARLAYLAAPGTVWALLPNAAFALLLASQIAPKFMSAAKKLRNKAIGPVLIGICLAAAGMQLLRLAGAGAMQWLLVFEAVLLFTLLMLFMGGRIIAPAVAGQFYRQGMDLEARVQPRIEAGLIISLLAACLLLAIPGLQSGAGLAAIAGGLLAWIRTARWQLWRIRGRCDLIWLGVGYGWLGLGLVLLGAALLGIGYRSAAVHALTVGAFGIFTFGVMARTRLQRAKLDPAANALIPVGSALISFAAAMRILAGIGLPQMQLLLWLAALAWSATFLLLLRLFMTTPAR